VVERAEGDGAFAALGEPEEGVTRFGDTGARADRRYRLLADGHASAKVEFTPSFCMTERQPVLSVLPSGHVEVTLADDSLGGSRALVQRRP
jgi:hypothetical protein